MNRRYAEFDALRVIALGMILICHFIRSVGFYNLDIPFGCVGNMIFFAMSGWLLGLAWYSKAYPAYGWLFLKRRLLRLAVPMWLFAVPYMTYLKITGYDLGVRDVIFNLMLLNWFDRIPGMTPYWFITAIATFYVVVLLLSHIRKMASNTILISLLIVVSSIGLQCLLTICGIRYGYILILNACGLLCFINAKLLYEKLSAKGANMLRQTATFLVVLLFVGFWIGVVCNAIIVGTPSCYYATIPVALCITATVFGLPQKIQVSGLVRFVSAISYEVYLVHGAMLLFMKSLSSNLFMYAVLFLFGTFACAIPLHFASQGIFRLMERQR